MAVRAPFDDPRWSALRRVPATTARGDISELLRGAERGDRVVITRSGKPVVAIVPLTDLAVLLHEDSSAEPEMMGKISRRALSTDENTIDFDELVGGGGGAAAEPQDRINALLLLARDHRAVEDLFEQFEKARGPSAKERLARRICTHLKIHSMIEEEIFYPALRGKIPDDDLDEAYVEHDGAKVLINEIEAGSPDDAFYDAKVKVLKEQIEHHVEEEEKVRGNIFQQARASDVDLEALGEQMIARKAELMAQAQSGALAPAALVTLQHERA